MWYLWKWSEERSQASEAIVCREREKQGEERGRRKKKRERERKEEKEKEKEGGGIAVIFQAEVGGYETVEKYTIFRFFTMWISLFNKYECIYGTTYK